MTVVSEIDAFITAQNKNRGGSLAGGGTVPLDYDLLTGSVPVGGNAVTGVAGIAAGAAAIALSSGQLGNAVIIDGAIGTAASTSGPDNYSLFVDTSGTATLTDDNTGNSQVITGASYLVFDGGASNSDGSFQGLKIIATGTTAEVAAMYNAALGRQPDLPGLEFYAIPTASGALTLHQDAGFFIDSPEFKADYPALSAPADNGGPNDQAFITELYGNILHRTPTASEVQFYIQYMQGTLSGETGPGNRPDLLIFFSVSPENQKDISTWLINPANGPVSFGSLTTQAAQAVLASEVASGTVNAADFASLSSAISDGNGGTDLVNFDGVTVYGATPTLHGFAVAGNIISAGPTSPANLTVTLDSQFFTAMMGAPNETVNGVPGGGSLIQASSNSPVANHLNQGGTANLAGNGNWVQFGNGIVGTIAVPLLINGWNSTDVLCETMSVDPNAPNSTHGLTYGFATNGDLTGQFGVVLSGSAGSPASLSAYQTQAGNVPVTTPYAVNVGTVADDSTASMVKAINSAFHVLDVAGERAFFFAQDPQGNTMVFYWRGDTGHAGSVQASDLTGAVELVGVQASGLTGANFHN